MNKETGSLCLLPPGDTNFPFSGPTHSSPLSAPASRPLARHVSSARASHQHPCHDQLSLQAKERLSHIGDESGSPGLKYASLLGVEIWKEFYFSVVLRSQTSTSHIFSLCSSLGRTNVTLSVRTPEKSDHLDYLLVRARPLLRENFTSPGLSFFTCKWD